VVDELRQLYCTTGLQFVIRVGKIVMDRIFVGDARLWHSRGRKDASFRRLEQHPDLPFRASTLSKAVGVYFLSQRRPDLADFTNLQASHFQELVALADDLQDRLLAQANDHAWSVRRLRAEIRLLTPRGMTSRGRPRLPGFVRSLRQIRDHVNERRLLADTDNMRIDLQEARELLDTTRRLCRQGEELARKLMKYLSSAGDPSTSSLPRSAPESTEVPRRRSGIAPRSAAGMQRSG
jgi:hypothetical protein